MFKKYTRPKRLSDPNCDFLEDELIAIINTPDEQMGFHEFSCLFQGCLPAGAYGEVIYFFPLAFEYILNNLENDDGAYSLFGDFLMWVISHESYLKRDKVWDYYWRTIINRINMVLSSFVLENSYSNQVSKCLEPKGIHLFWAIDESLELSRSIYKNEIEHLFDFENIFKERFERIETYASAAWLIYLGMECKNIVSYKQWGKKLPSQKNAYQMIHEYVRTNTCHRQFWEGRNHCNYNFLREREL